jgi:dipeptidyl aminopeptidase/acylaminoacyl peptidase
LYLYDLTTRSLKHLTPHTGDVLYDAIYFSKNSQYLYYLTDESSEFTYLKRLHIASGLSETVEQHSWDISSCRFSYNEKYRITGINEDGRQRIQIFNQQTNQAVTLPNLPEGEMTQAKISRSEKLMLFYINGDRSPNNLYCYNLETMQLHKLTNSLSPEINSEDLVDAEIIRYPSYDGTLIPALYYKPKNMQKESKIPALLWIHGGPGGQSTIGYNYLIQFLVNHGYPILCVNNRGSSGYGKSFFKSADHKHGEADLDDCIWAKHYLAASGQVDPNKIGIMGGSYGGYMTLAALAFRSNEMALGVDIFGVSNWVRTLKSIPPWWEAGREALYKKIGNPNTETAYLESISPLFHATNIKKPLLVIQGANDPRVLKIESDQMIEAVNKNGIPNQYVIFDDEGHGFLKKQNQMTAATIILQFLEQHLKDHKEINQTTVE